MSAHSSFHPEHHHAPRPAPKRLGQVSLLLIAIGVVSLFGGFALGPDQVLRTRGVIVVNLAYFMGVSMGGLVLAAVMHITWARWGRPVKRIAESFVLAMPVFWLVLVAFIVLLGGLEIYEWYTHPETLHGHKSVYLTAPFFSARMIGGIGLMTLFGLLFWRNSVRADVGVAARTVGDTAPAWWGRIAANWQGDEAEAETTWRKNHVISPIIVALYAVIWSMVAFDLVMSLAPHWYANMFGAWYFAACFWLGLIWTGLVTLGCRGWLGIGHLTTPTLFHDLGKLVFAFCVFWTYLFYAQLLPIWYGNMTEEIGFLMVRFALDPWSDLSKVVGAMCFFIPFVTLLSRGVKKMPAAFFGVLTFVAVGIWLDFFLLVMPSIWIHETLPLGPIELGVTAGFLGAFLYVVQRALSSVPAVPFSDRCMFPDPRHVHVHADQAAK